MDEVKKEYFLGCHIKWQCVTILLYADDIIIITPSIISLQKIYALWNLNLNI